MKVSPKRRRRIRQLGILVLILVSGFIFSWQGLFAVVIAPIAVPLNAAGSAISNTIFWWRSAAIITAEELEVIHAQRNQFAVDQSEFIQLQEENARLKRELAFVERTQFSYISGRIMAKSLSHSTSRFIIDVGSEQGVQLGEAVITDEGIFVGKITQLGSHSATVTAITDPALSVAVSLLNQSRTIGIASGSVGDLLLIDFIPIDEVIPEFSLVVTSGLDDTIPSGLLLGSVNTVREDIGSPFYQAIVEPLADIRRISTVLILSLDHIQ